MASLALTEGEVHVWHVPLDEWVQELVALCSLLGPDERARADRFHFERDRRQYCLARALLRRLLEHYGVGPAANIEFSYSERGKPRLAARHNSSRLHFNLAHSGDMAVFALARSCPLGIDVECVRAVPDAGQIVRSMFAAEEETAYESVAPAARELAFFNAWTRKEAFIKATGEGLGRSLQSFAVTLTPGQPARFLHIDGDPAAAAAWLLADLSLAPPYIVALAVRGTGISVSNRLWPAPVPVT